jgi:glycosyltransferase involved in cell wall biosynthesis
LSSWSGESTDGTGTIAEQSGATTLTDSGRGKGEAIRKAIPHIRTPVTVFLDADGSHDPEDIPLLVEPHPLRPAPTSSPPRACAGIERAARRLRRVPASRRQLVHHGVHQLAVRLPAERQPERLPRRADVECCGS